MMTNKKTITQFDIAIIGGGISGLYSSYRLKKKYPHKKIALFEMLPILGGRIQTGSFVGGLFLPGFGALRIEPDFQTETHKFLQELQIPVQKIEQGEAKSSSIPDLSRLSSEEKDIILKNPDKGADVVLLELGLKKILHNQWNLETLDKVNKTRDELIDLFRSTATYKDKPLYQQGAWNVFSDVLSYEAIEFFREKGAYYNMKNDNQNAADWIVLLLNQRSMKQPSYLPKLGMIEMVNAITQEIKSLGVEIHLNHGLQALHQYDETSVFMQFEDTGHVVAKQVVLSLPQYPLKKLAPYFPKRVATLLESVIPVPILWVAATLKNPPWGDGTDPTSGENAPFRAAHLEYKKHQDTAYGMAMFYCDGPWREYWRYFIEDNVQNFEGYQYLPQVNKNSFLKCEIEKSLKQMFNLQKTPIIDEWGIRDWGRPPFGAGVHFWKVGVQSKTVIQELTAFSLKESGANKNVHICGEAYSEFQGYFEGAIRTANSAIKTIEQSNQELET